MVIERINQNDLMDFTTDLIRCKSVFFDALCSSDQEEDIVPNEQPLALSHDVRLNTYKYKSLSPLWIRV